MRMNGGLERSRQTRRKLLKHGADIRAARSEWRLPDLYEGDCGIDVIGPEQPSASSSTAAARPIRRDIRCDYTMLTGANSRGADRAPIRCGCANCCSGRSETEYSNPHALEFRIIR